jgi:hypothetical protein
VRALKVHDLVTTAARTPMPVRGRIRRLNVGRRTANVEWDGDAPDKGNPGWRSQLREYPIDLLVLVVPTECPDCGGALQFVDDGEIWTPGGRLNGKPWRRPAAFVACGGCEFCQEV